MTVKEWTLVATLSCLAGGLASAADRPDDQAVVETEAKSEDAAAVDEGTPGSAGAAAIPGAGEGSQEGAAVEPGVDGAVDREALRAQGNLDLKLRAIEERVNALKEKIFESKARLVQLQEVVLHGTISGAKAVLIHRNEMGSSFRLVRAQYALDGAPIFNRVDHGDGKLDDQEEIEIFNGNIAPGNHQISVYLEYQGNGYGVFSYLKGYRFRVKSSYTLNAEEGKQTIVRIVGYERGGLTTELKDRPAVRFDVEVQKALRNETSGAKAGSSDEEASGD